MGYVGWQLAANPLRYYWKRSVSHICMCYGCIVFSTINFAMGKVGGFFDREGRKCAGVSLCQQGTWSS